MTSPAVDTCTDVLFIHGAGDDAHHVDGALVDALGQALGDGFRIHFPRMPGGDDPDNVAWKGTIVAEARRTKAGVVVGHSAGGAIVADMLAQGRQRMDLPHARAIFLLAPPFIGRGGWDFEGFHFDRPVDDGTMAGLQMHLYFGTSDATVPQSHADLYAKVFPQAVIHRLAGCDHQFAGHLPRVARDVLSLRVIQKDPTAGRTPQADPG
jgi:pimeloyl-ACP methyl ester carboxylesterase